MERSHILYWIWLSTCVAPGSKASDLLLEYFDGNAQKIYEGSDEDYAKAGVSSSVRAKLAEKGSEEARRIYFWCRENGVRLLPYDDPAFPARLRNVEKRPVLLYCKGRQIDLNDNLLVAMVGTRRMTEYGFRSAYTISYDASCAGAVIVSGMASGVDTASHRGALDAGRPTIAVIGTGIDVVYPKENAFLAEELAKNGMLLSEYRPGTRPAKHTFPNRNRIISGISQGTLVIEAGLHSGAMITAQYAQQQGRDLFALPGMVGEDTSDGPNHLLREGAVPVTSARELLSEYAMLYPGKIFLERIPLFRSQAQLSRTKGEGAAKAGTPDPEISEGSGAESRAGAPRSRKTKAASPAKTKKEEKSEPETRQKPALPAGMSGSCATIYALLCEAQAPESVDALTEKSRLSAAEVSTALTLLEIRGVVQALPGSRYSLHYS